MNKEKEIKRDIEQVFQTYGLKQARLIGNGAFAWVYHVQEERTGRVLACKVSENRKMLFRENEILQRICHPLFPCSYGVRQSGQLTFLFLEYVAGINLKTLLERRRGLSERQTICIGMQLAEGLLYLHQLSEAILFLDLKPENIMIREDGRVVLLDFGSAGTINQMTGILTGTPGYAAPEQFQIGGKIGIYSDVYALGQVLYRMCPVCRLGVKQVWKDCMRERADERIPDMRVFLQRMRPYASKRKSDRVMLWLKAYFHIGNAGEYYFQKNIVQISKRIIADKL